MKNIMNNTTLDFLLIYSILGIICQEIHKLFLINPRFFMIEVRDLSFVYSGNAPLFERLSFSVGDGELLMLNAPSGRGKTTLMYCLCGIIPRNIKGEFVGSVSIDGKAVADMTAAELPRAAAMVFQEPGSRIFLPAVEDELAFTLENMCVPREKIRESIDCALELTGLSGKRYENPANLSGGQLKLLALASVLAFPPRVLLLDEITAGLDNSALDRVKYCVELFKAQGCAVIVSDHNAQNTQIWGEDANELGI